MKCHKDDARGFHCGSKLSHRGSQKGSCNTRPAGFTLLELIIVVAIVAIMVALAVPTWQSIVEKRQLTGAAEEIKSFLTFAQSEAIKRNEEVTIHWYTPGSHNVNWCIGATLGEVVCDCRETVVTEPDFCNIDGLPYRLVQTDFVDIDFELMHMNPVMGSFSYDPVRGILVNISDTEIIDDDYLFYIHSDEGSGSTREYELEIRLNITGRVRICTDPYRERIIGGYPEC